MPGFVLSIKRGGCLINQAIQGTLVSHKIVTGTSTIVFLKHVENLGFSLYQDKLLFQNSPGQYADLLKYMFSSNEYVQLEVHEER